MDAPQPPAACRQQQIDWDTLQPCTPPPKVEGATIEEQFRSFHRQNPHVYMAIVSLARTLKHQEKWTKAGMKQIFEQLRWKYAMKTRGDKWNFNNNYTAHYARLVMQQEKDLAGFFETREPKPQE